MTSENTDPISTAIFRRKQSADKAREKMMASRYSVVESLETDAERFDRILNDPMSWQNLEGSKQR